MKEVTLRNFIDKLETNGVRIGLAGDELSVKFPKGKINQELLEEVKLKKQQLIDYLSSLSFQVHAKIPKVEEQENYILSSAQLRLWVLNQLENGSSAYNISTYVEVNENINIANFDRAILSTIERHEILRTVFRGDLSGNPKQYIISPLEINFKLNYCDYKDLINKEEFVKAYIEEDKYKAFDLQNGPLLRATLICIDDNKYIFYYNMHHIISDGWSISVLSKDVLTYYEAYCRNEEPALEQLHIQYKDYAAWQIFQLQDSSYQKHKLYWQEKLSGGMSPLELPGSKIRPKILSHNGIGLSTYIDKETTKKLKQFVNQEGGTLFMGLLASWNTLIYRYTNQTDITIGTPIAGRNHADLANQIGLYINTLALRTVIDPTENFNVLFQKIKKDTLAAYDHQSYPFDKIVEDLKTNRDTSRNALFDVMLSLLNNIENTMHFELSDKEMSDIFNEGACTSKFDLDVTFQEIGDYLSLNFIFNKDIYEEDFIRQLITHYKQLLAAVLNKPDQQLATVSYLLEEEKQQLWVDFNGHKINYPKNITVINLIEEQVVKTPNAIAIIFDNKEITYKELNERSNRLAHFLNQHYVIQADDLIGVKLERSEWMVISILAILKAGAAYVPIDPDFPEERIKYIKDNGNLKITIDSDVISSFCDVSLNYKSDNLKRIISPNNLAYVIYTSGTTGSPKGVMNEHGGLYNRLLWMKNDLSLNNTDIFLQKTPFTFDVSVWELIVPFVIGSKLIIAKPNGHKDPYYLESIIYEYKVSIIHFVPSMLDVFISEIDPANCGSIKHIICSGEALSSAIVNKTKSKLITAFIHNFYGPTEAAIDVTSIDLTAVDTQNAHVTIGRPVANTSIYILNKHLNIEPRNVVGEIFIGGVQVARGYLNRADLTAQKFINDPFHPGERLYKTGDLGRLLADGTIDYIGRIDDQVKIRGHRIELGEIESKLLQKNTILSCAVNVTTAKDGGKDIVAYIVSDKEEVVSELRAYLKQWLPEYMLPAYFVQLPEIPVTSNGKINKKALPDPKKAGVISGRDFVQPLTEIELKLAAIWQNLLQTEMISMTDDFFELGGHSLMAIRLINEYHKQFNVKIDLKDVFNNSVISSHVEVISGAKKDKYQDITRTPDQESYTLSAAQKRVWLVSQFEGGSLAYNMPSVITLNQNISIDYFKRAVLLTIQRHEILRTVFKQNNEGEPRQHILSLQELNFSIESQDLRSYKNAEEAAEKLISSDIVIPFDLVNGPLIRAILIKISDTVSLFYYNMHHIICDGWSMDVLEKDVMAYYTAFVNTSEPALDELNIQYKDYVVWSGDKIKEVTFQEQKQNLLNKFISGVPKLDLLFSKKRPKIRTYNGSSISTKVDDDVYAGLKKLANENNTTMFMNLVSVVGIMLYKNSFQKSIIIGSPISNRSHSNLKDQIGLYVNSIPLKIDINTENSYQKMLSDIKENVLDAYSNQDYPFDLLVEDLKLKKDLSRNPLFDVFLVMNETADAINLSGNENSQYTLSVSKFDISFYFNSGTNNLLFDIVYNTDLFERASIENILIELKALLKEITIDSQRSLPALCELITDEQVKNEQVKFESDFGIDIDENF